MNFTDDVVGKTNNSCLLSVVCVTWEKTQSWEFVKQITSYLVIVFMLPDQGSLSWLSATTTTLFSQTQEILSFTMTVCLFSNKNVSRDARVVFGIDCSYGQLILSEDSTLRREKWASPKNFLWSSSVMKQPPPTMVFPVITYVEITENSRQEYE
jgi:hypothetical protein